MDRETKDIILGSVNDYIEHLEKGEKIRGFDMEIITDWADEEKVLKSCLPNLILVFLDAYKLAINEIGIGWDIRDDVISMLKRVSKKLEVK